MTTRIPQCSSISFGKMNPVTCRRIGQRCSASLSTLPDLHVEPGIIDFRTRVQGWLENADLVHPHEPRQRAGASFRLAEDPRLGGTHFHAARTQSLDDPMIAEGAFLGSPAPGIDEPRSVRTGLQAIAAADAAFGINENDSVPRFESGPHGADLDAGRAVALIAELRHKEAPAHRFFLRLELEPVEAAVGTVDDDFAAFEDDVSFDPSPEKKRPGGDVVFFLASVRAPAAADALVDGEPPAPGIAL